MRPQYLSFLLGPIVFGVSLMANAQTFDINLSSDSAQFKYGTLIGNTNYGRSEIKMGLLYNEDDDGMVEFGFHVIDAVGSKAPGLEVGVGPKIYYAEAKDAKAAALGLGGHIRYKLPGANRFLLGGSYHYAPSIVSYLDADNMYELTLTFAYELLPTANIYVGYRDIEIDSSEYGEQEVDSSAYVGVSLSF